MGAQKVASKMAHCYCARQKINISGVHYWKLKVYLRAKLEGWVFGAAWPLIWWIWGGFRLPGAFAADIRADSTLIRC